MVKPISPGEVTIAKKQMIPDGVIEAFNQTIAKHFNGRSASFKQEEVLNLITTKMGVDRAHVFSEKWLDVEDIYRAEGWKVKYDSPAYCESYPATFEFKR